MLFPFLKIRIAGYLLKKENSFVETAARARVPIGIIISAGEIQGSPNCI